MMVMVIMLTTAMVIMSTILYCVSSVQCPHCWCASSYLLCWAQKCPHGGSGGGGQLGTKCRRRRLLWSAGSRAKERFSTLPDAHFVSLLLPKSQAVVFKGLNIFHQHNIAFHFFQLILKYVYAKARKGWAHTQSPIFVTTINTTLVIMWQCWKRNYLLQDKIEGKTD